jgi:hypothetical protein
MYKGRVRPGPFGFLRRPGADPERLAAIPAGDAGRRLALPRDVLAAEATQDQQPEAAHRARRR